LSSYVSTDGKGAIETFEKLAQKSCSEYENGIEALAVLKGDVDNMGDYIRTAGVTKNYASFDMFSKSIDGFFSRHIPEMMAGKYPDTYTVFAGGDDLFLIGAWNEVLDLARDIEAEFKRFVKSDKLSISMGIILAKPTTPISYLADISEEALEEFLTVTRKHGLELQAIGHMIDDKTGNIIEIQ